MYPNGIAVTGPLGGGKKTKIRLFCVDAIRSGNVIGLSFSFLGGWSDDAAGGRASAIDGWGVGEGQGSLCRLGSLGAGLSGGKKCIYGSGLCTTHDRGGASGGCRGGRGVLDDDHVADSTVCVPFLNFAVMDVSKTLALSGGCGGHPNGMVGVHDG